MKIDFLSCTKDLHIFQPAACDEGKPRAVAGTSAGPQAGTRHLVEEIYGNQHIPDPITASNY